MTFLDVVMIALIQGIGEVLPLGANGHLAFLSALNGPPEQRMAVSIAAHAGIVLALALYFWRDMGAMGLGLWKLAKGRPDSGTRLFMKLVTGSIPAALITWAVMRSGLGLEGAMVSALAMVVFGLLLLVADSLGMTVRRVDHIGYAGAFIIGLLQPAALIPGVSRTGITITAARFMGYEREEAARFSLLLAMPVFTGAAIHTAWKLSRSHELVISTDVILTAGVAGVAALIAVAAMMAWVRNGTYLPFALWRIVLGVGMVMWITTGL